MNQWIRAVEIAERPLEPVRSGLEHEPLVRLAAAHLDGQPQLERHVEARHAAAELDPREVVKGVSAPLNQLTDPLESSLGARDLDHRARTQPEPAQSRDGRQIQRRVLAVEGNVYESLRSGSELIQRARPAWAER